MIQEILGGHNAFLQRAPAQKNRLETGQISGQFHGLKLERFQWHRSSQQILFHLELRLRFLYNYTPIFNTTTPIHAQPRQEQVGDYDDFVASKANAVKRSGQ